MPSRPPEGDAETLATDAGIASDETIDQGAHATPAHVATGPVIRASRISIGPARLGRYTTIRQLGRGGMGAVFEADDPELARRVAIKVLRDDRTGEQFTEGLRREAQALAKLVHPNVVLVYDVGVDDGQLFVVMQLIEGEPIDQWLRGRHASTRAIIDAFRQAGNGLAAAHAANLVHCDFKPANVLVDKDGVIRVSDFGLARIGAEDEGSVAGTPAYMPPEQFTGVATAASDQYAFCVALYEVLTGAQPFRDSQITDPDAANARVVPPIPRAARVPARVARALQRGLSRDPADRFPSMDALLAALAPPSPRLWIGAGAGIAAVAATVIVGYAMRSPPAAFEARPAKRVVGQPDLGAAHPLTHYGTDACAYAPSIDGDTVVFDRTEGDAVDLYRMPLGGGTPKQLTSAPTWEWRSNPGRHHGEVVHLIHDPNVVANATVAFLDLATGTETTAASVAADDAVVIADGLVYVSRGGDELRRVRAGRDTLLVHAPTGALFAQLASSHAGDRVATISVGDKRGSICIVDASTGTSECSEAHALGFRPAFGADDRFVYYAANDGIHGRELATGADALVIPDANPQGGLAISADGRVLVYSDCGTRSQIVDLQTQPPTLLVDDPSASAPSSSEGVIVWLRRVHDRHVLMMRAADGQQTQLTDPEFGSISSPAISPDGSKVLFKSAQPHPGIYNRKLPLDREPLRITDNDHDGEPVWVGDSQVAFNRYDDRESPTVWVGAADGAELHALQGSSRFVVGGVFRHLLVASSTTLHWVDLKDNTSKVGPPLGAIEVSGVATSPNGHWLVTRSGPEGQVVQRMSLEPPGKLEPLQPVPSGQTIAGASITNEGHVIAALQTWSGDLHVIPAKPNAPY